MLDITWQQVYSIYNVGFCYMKYIMLKFNYDGFEDTTTEY